MAKESTKYLMPVLVRIMLLFLTVNAFVLTLMIFLYSYLLFSMLFQLCSIFFCILGDEKKAKFDIGKQPKNIPGTNSVIFVMPSSSARYPGTSIPELAKKK